MIHSINRFITDFANLFVDGHSQHGGETMLIEEHVKKHPYVNLTDNDIEKVNFDDRKMKYLMKNPEILGYEPIFGKYIGTQIYELNQFAKYLSDTHVENVLNTFYKISDNGTFVPDRKTQILGFMIQSGYYCDWMYMIFDIFKNILNKNDELRKFNKKILDMPEIKGQILRMINHSEEYKCIMNCIELIIENTELENIKNGLSECRIQLNRLLQLDTKDDDIYEELNDIYNRIFKYTKKGLKKDKRNIAGLTLFIESIIRTISHNEALKEEQIAILKETCTTTGYRCVSIHIDNIYDKLDYKLSSNRKKLEDLSINVIQALILNSMRINVYPPFMITGMLSGYYFETTKLYYKDEYFDMFNIYVKNVKRVMDDKYIDMKRNEYEYTRYKRYVENANIRTMSLDKINLYSEVSKATYHGIKFSACMETAILNLVRVLSSVGVKPKDEKYKLLLEIRNPQEQIDTITLYLAEDERLKSHMVKADHELNATKLAVISTLKIIYDIKSDMNSVTNVFAHLNSDIEINNETDKSITFKINNTGLTFSYNGQHGVIKYDIKHMNSKCLYDEVTITNNELEISYKYITQNMDMYFIYKKRSKGDNIFTKARYKTIPYLKEDKIFQSPLDSLNVDNYSQKYIYCDDLEYVATNLKLIEYGRVYLDILLNKECVLNENINKIDSKTTDIIIVLIGNNMRTIKQNYSTKRFESSSEKEVNLREKKIQKYKLRKNYMSKILDVQEMYNIPLINKNVLNTFPVMIMNMEISMSMDMGVLTKFDDNVSAMFEMLNDLDLEYDEKTLGLYTILPKLQKIVLLYEKNKNSVKYDGDLLDDVLNFHRQYFIDEILTIMDTYGYKFTKETLNMLYNSQFISDMYFLKIFENISELENVSDYYNNYTLELAFSQISAERRKKLLELEEKHGKKYDEKTITHIIQNFKYNNMRGFDFNTFLAELLELIEFTKDNKSYPKNFVGLVLKHIGNYRITTNLENYMKIYNMLKANANIYTPENIGYVYLTNSLEEVHEYHRQLHIEYDDLENMYYTDFVYDGDMRNINGLDILQNVYNYTLVKQIIDITLHHLSNDTQYTAFLLRMLCRKKLVCTNCENGKFNEHDEQHLLNYIIETNNSKFNMVEKPFERYCNWMLSRSNILNTIDIIMKHYGTEYSNYIIPCILFVLKRMPYDKGLVNMPIIKTMILKIIDYLTPTKRTAFIFDILNMDYQNYSKNTEIRTEISESINRIIDEHECDYVFNIHVMENIVIALRYDSDLAIKIFDKIKTDELEYNEDLDSKLRNVYRRDLSDCENCTYIRTYLTRNNYMNPSTHTDTPPVKRRFGRRFGQRR
jgi:hypothetical protein